MDRIAGWVADRGYQKILIANEDVKKSSERSVIHGVLIPPCASTCNRLPNVTAYFRLISIEFSKRISVSTSKTPFPPFVEGDHPVRDAKGKLRTKSPRTGTREAGMSEYQLHPGLYAGVSVYI